MAYDYGFGDLGNALYDACTDYPPNFEKIKALIAAGMNINAVSDDEPDETLLSKIIFDHPQVRDILLYCGEDCDKDNCEDCPFGIPKADGRYLPQIVKLFLEHGFDCSLRDGKAGGMCLMNLTRSSCDSYILDAAKLLLDAGADPMCSPHSDSEETVLSWVATKISAAYCVYNDWGQAVLFTALYEILDAARNGTPYKDITIDSIVPLE